jgi:hypothetical protein
MIGATMTGSVATAGVAGTGISTGGLVSVGTGSIGVPAEIAAPAPVSSCNFALAGLTGVVTTGEAGTSF